MLRTKLPLLILLILLIVSGVITFQFYSDKQKLIKENENLKQIKARLTQENKSLYSQYREMEKSYKMEKRRLDEIQKELAKIEQSRDELKNKYMSVSKERDELVEKIKNLMQYKEVTSRRAEKEEIKIPESGKEYWADMIRQKAELQAKLENIQKELLNSKAQIAKLQKDNKELSLKIDELVKTKEELDREISFKERTMQIMSKDLVMERETRKKLADEVKKLRDENISLKRELIMANNDKIKLQDKLKDAIERKVELEKTVSEVKNVLKEKILLFSELENQFAKAVEDKRAYKSEESASVELPPIVVKSEGIGSILRGEILAVNKNDNFVIIDLGENAGVKPGMEFNIIREGNAIGRIKVIETRREISAADIEKLSPRYFIREGDTVILR